MIPFITAAWTFVLSAHEHEAFPSTEKQNGVSIGRRYRWCMLPCVHPFMLFLSAFAMIPTFILPRLTWFAFFSGPLGLPVFAQFPPRAGSETMIFLLPFWNDQRTHSIAHRDRGMAKITWEHRARISCNDFRFSNSYDTLAWATIGRWLHVGVFFVQDSFCWLLVGKDGEVSEL
jgi:hypothetical protein